MANQLLQVQQPISERETIRCLHLSLVLDSCLLRLKCHHEKMWRDDSDRVIGWTELEDVIKEADLATGQQHNTIEARFRWSGHHNRMAQHERIFDVTPTICNALLGAMSSSRLEKALNIMIPVMTKLAHWAYKDIPLVLWIGTLKANGMAELARDLQDEVDTRTHESAEPSNFMELPAPWNLEY